MKYTEQFAAGDYLTDKIFPHSYGSEVYDELFEPIQHTCKNYLEIGSFYGGSALLARDYFTEASIWTIDIKPSNHRIKWADRIHNIQGDAYIAWTAKKIPPTMDIIIEDGSHRIQHQVTSIDIYLPKLAVNGVFIIEDVDFPDESFHLFDAVVNKHNVWSPYADEEHGNRYTVRKYVGKEYYTNSNPSRVKEYTQEIQEFGALNHKSYNDNLYLVTRVK